MFRPALLIIDMQEDFCPPSGSLAVPNAQDTLAAINTLLASPGLVLRAATQDSHPRTHISFASNHTAATTSDGQPPRPFASHTRIANPLNPSEVVQSRLWPDHCVQGTPGERLLDDLDLGLISQLDPKLTEQIEQLYHAAPEAPLDLRYCALSNHPEAIIKKGLVPSLEQYSAFAPPFRDPPLHETPLLTVLLRSYGVTHVYVVGLAYDYCVRETALDAVRQGFTTFVVEEATRAVDDSNESLDALRVELENGGVHVLRGALEDIPEVLWLRDPPRE